LTGLQPDIVSAPSSEPVTGSPGSPAGTRAGRGARTRRRILDAAESVFAELGYHDASIVRITERAGVAQGTFYIYFSSKQQVFDEVVLDLNHRVRQAMAEASSGAPNRLEAERRGFAAFFDFTAEHPSLYRLIRQAEFVSPEILHHHYERIIAGYIPHLEAAMASGEVARTDPTVLAWALIAVGEMAGMRWILWDDHRSMPPAVFEELVAVIGRMLGTGASAARGDANTDGVQKEILQRKNVQRKTVQKNAQSMNVQKRNLQKRNLQKRNLQKRNLQRKEESL
jgi:AcrR family transcriptional regulator